MLEAVVAALIVVGLPAIIIGVAIALLGGLEDRRKSGGRDKRDDRDER